MSILAKIKDIDYDFICENSFIWLDIAENCPSLEKVFPEKIYSGLKNVVSPLEPLKYEINYTDSKLRNVMSELDKYKNNLVFDDISYKTALELKNLIHKAMSKKKNIEVKCLWTKGWK